MLLASKERTFITKEPLNRPAFTRCAGLRMVYDLPLYWEDGFYSPEFTSASVKSSDPEYASIRKHPDCRDSCDRRSGPSMHGKSDCSNVCPNKESCPSRCS
jgi:hypothetical protein